MNRPAQTPRFALGRARMAVCSLGLALLLTACSTMEEMFDEPIDPSPSTASSSDGERGLAPISIDGPAQPPPPGIAAALSELPSDQGTLQITPTGTLVGDKVVQLGGDFAAMQQSVRTHTGQFAQSQTKNLNLTGQYYSTVASINTRLQTGTTAGNPLLGQQWDDAQAKLAETGGNILRLRELRSLAASDAIQARFLQSQVQSAYSLSGAVEEDHRHLAMLEEGIAREIASIEGLLTRIDTDMARQSAYIANERLNMTTLALAIKSGEPYSPNAPNGSPASAPPKAAAKSRRQQPPATVRGNKAARSRTASAERKPDRQPILVIDFSSANTADEASLYAAVSDAIASRPSARFEVVGVTPGAKPGASPSASRRNARRVVRSLVNMGLPQSRLRETAQTRASASSEQVLVYAL